MALNKKFSTLCNWVLDKKLKPESHLPKKCSVICFNESLSKMMKLFREAN